MMQAGQHWTAETIKAEAERRAEQEQASFCPVDEQDTPGAGGCFDSAFVLKCLYQNQVGDAEIFKRLHQGLFLYDHAAGTWFKWAGDAWEQDKTESVVAAMQAVCRVYETELQRVSWRANQARGKKDD
jgi:putative DNA primase/helicase